MPPKKNIITLLKDRETEANIIPLTNNNNDTVARLEHKQRFQQTLNSIRPPPPPPPQTPPRIDRRNVGGRKTIRGGRGEGRG
jgi:hypothetical protein